MFVACKTHNRDQVQIQLAHKLVVLGPSKLLHQRRNIRRQAIVVACNWLLVMRHDGRFGGLVLAHCVWSTLARKM